MNRIGGVVGLFLMCATTIAPSAFAVDRRVPQDYPNLQAAVNAAVNGDDIVLSPGTWEGFGVSNKSLKVRSTGSFATTRITSQCGIYNAPNGFEFEDLSILGTTLTVDSTALTFDRVRAASVSVGLSGTAQAAVVDSELNNSAIYIANQNLLPGTHTITNSVFRNNAYFHPRGSLQVTDSQFVACGYPINVEGSVDIGNSEFQGGIGGLNLVRATSLTVVNSTFRDFVGAGALYTTDSATISGCAFTGVRITPSGSNIFGGAVSAGGTLSISQSSFIDCSGAAPSGVAAVYGVAVAQRSNASATITNCTFSNCNTAATVGVNVYGGAISSYGPLTVTGSTFTDCGGTAAQQGGAIYSQTTSTNLTDCTFVGNSINQFSQGGGAVFLIGNATITRCKFSNGTSGSGGALYYASGGSVPFASALIQECFFSANIANLPDYGRDIATAGGATAIAFLSQNTFCATEAQACSGFYFEKGPNTFGADCASDCDGDGLPNAYELKIGLDADCNGNDIPDSCEAGSGSAPDCNANGIPDACDIANGAADCNQNGVPDTCEPDCDGDGIPNACEIATGAADCDANGVPDSCQSDCDNDGVIDACEIAAGAPDCNTNGIPDSCEIANGSVADFNKDGVLDPCQPQMQFAGLELEIVPIVNRGLDDLFPQTAVCYRLYARTTVTGAAVVGLFGNPAHPLTLSAAGGFWQSPFGGDLASQVPCNLSGVLPSAKYDSWFTVGLACAAGNLVQNTGLDLAAFNNGGGISDNDGIIFVQPGSAQSISGSSNRVLLAQLTTNSAVLPTGFIDVVGRSADGTAAWEAYAQAIPVPALVDCNQNGVQDAFDIANGTSRDCDQSGVPDTCEYGSASTDCNGNGIPDLCDVISAFSADLNGNFVPDECECSGDVDGNGVVNVDDIIDVIAAWGSVGDNPADVNNDDVVGAADLAIVLAGYGSCL